MNLNNINKREILDFEQFRDKVHDGNYKPLSPENQSGDKTRSGISAINREPAFDFAGYNDSVFAGRSSINYPGLNVRNPRTGKLTSLGDLGGAEDAAGLVSGGGVEIGTELSESGEPFTLARLNDMFYVNENLSTPAENLKGTINNLLDREFRGIDPIKAAEVFEFFAKVMRANDYRERNNIGPARANFGMR